MGMNFSQLMLVGKFKKAMQSFGEHHPKFPMFLKMVYQKNVFREGTVIEIDMKTLEGESYKSNFRVTAKDIELFESLKELVQQK